jgi:hypothetical protein
MIEERTEEFRWLIFMGVFVGRGQVFSYSNPESPAYVAKVGRRRDHDVMLMVLLMMVMVMTMTMTMTVMTRRIIRRRRRRRGTARADD